jgi:MFS family permease
MHMSVTLISDLAINLIALISILIATSAVRSVNLASDTELRLRSLFRVVAILLVLRVLVWLGVSKLFDIGVLIAAAWLPFFALLLAEQLLRRHAPASLKWLALSGSIGFCILALFTGSFWPLFVMSALAAFQLILLTAIVALLILRRKDGLAPSETDAADSMAMALVLTLPFAIGDFRSIFPELPIRFGALGILLFTLSMVRIAARSASPRRIVLDYLGIFLASITLALLIGFLVNDKSIAMLTRLFFIIAAVITAMLLLQRNRDLNSTRASSASIGASLAALPDAPKLDELLSSHPTLASGVIVDEAALGIYDPAVIGVLSQHRVISAQTPLPINAMDAANNLLLANSASHMVRICKKPAKFLTLACGPFSGSKSVETELTIVSRFAEDICK